MPSFPVILYKTLFNYGISKNFVTKLLDYDKRQQKDRTIEEGHKLSFGIDGCGKRTEMAEDLDFGFVTSCPQGQSNWSSH